MPGSPLAVPEAGATGTYGGAKLGTGPAATRLDTVRPAFQLPKKVRSAPAASLRAASSVASPAIGSSSGRVAGASIAKGMGSDGVGGASGAGTAARPGHSSTSGMLNAAHQASNAAANASS